MPRYYFDLLDGKTQCDQVGAELADDAAAKQEGVLRSLNGTAHQLDQYKGSEEIAVRNDRGQRIFRTLIKRKKD
jgi:hypothetical protein